MFIKIRTTPNENALQFVVPKQLINFTWECNDENDAKKSELANELWNLNDITYMLFCTDFISITKKQNVDWIGLEHKIIDIISIFLNKNVAFFNVIDSKIESILNIEDKIEFNRLEQQLLKVIEEKVQPAVALHGGFIKLISFKDGIVLLDLQGACRGCSGSETTLKDGIQNLLQYYFPEIKEVRNVV